MNALRSIRCILSTVLVLTLLGSSVVVDVAAAQNEPVIGPSGTADASIMMPDYKGPVTALAETFGIEGGVDIPLPCSICHSLRGTNEPAIAVNPLNSANIAVASLFELRVSTNNGMNFSDPIAAVVPATHRLAGDPSLAFDSQGRLFWTYLGSRTDTRQLDIFISQVDPSTGAILDKYPVNVTVEAGFPASVAGNNNDKEWLTADRFSGNRFQDRLYVVWTRFTATGTVVHTTFSTDQGLTWSSALTLSEGEEGFVWPSHNAVAPNGDVYVAYHSQPRFVNRNRNGTSGQVFVLRSTDGGATYPQKTIAYTAGNADITFNVQTVPEVRALNGSISWTQGSAQPWVLPDPVNPNNVYVVAADDPTNTDHGDAFDNIDVFIVHSTDRGRTWGTPVQVNEGPVGTTQFFPTAAIDDKSQCLTITWYDTRAESTNAAGNFLLDVFLRSSSDGGLTFSPEVQLNDVPFDPDLGAPCRFGPQPPCQDDSSPLQTLRIGEYNGVAVANGIAHAVWTGNTATGQQILFDSALACSGGSH